MINLLLTGATGKMGRQIISLAKSDPKISSIIGLANQDTTIDDISVISDSNSIKNTNLDIIIDFSHHQLINSVLDIALERKIPLVIGTTGFTTAELATIKDASKYIPILLSANMSIGVNKFVLLLEQASKLFWNSDASILDIHHKYKLDSPSGTAKWLAEVADIPQDKIASMRVGDIVGTHSVVFGLENETITLSHTALDRSIFAKGSLTTMHWLLGKPAGIYSMRDIFSTGSRQQYQNSV